MTAQNTAAQALRQAVDLADHAPSFYNAQPWSWRLGDETAELVLDGTRRFPVTDPETREMTIGCGAALHHLQVALAGAGWRWTMEPTAGPGDDGPLARVRVGDRGSADPRAEAMAGAIPLRHTDRHPFSADDVSADSLETMRSSVDVDGVHLQILTRAQDRIWLSVLTARAAELQIVQDGYAAELASVTGGPAGRTGIAAQAVPHVVSPRHSDVTLRDFELAEAGTMPIPESVDEHPVWCILWTDQDSRDDWFRAGQALSRLLLTATSLGLATGVQSQPVEVPTIRTQLDGHLLAKMGHAQVLVRLGWAAAPDAPPGGTFDPGPA